MKITLEDHTKECADGCCRRFGYNVFIDGDSVGWIEHDATALAAMLNVIFEHHTATKLPLDNRYN